MSDSAQQLVSSLTSRLKTFNGMAQEFSPGHYTRLCSQNNTNAYCADIPRLQIRYLKRIARKYGEEAAYTYNQLALVQLSMQFWDKMNTDNLPAPLIELITDWFERIYKDISHQDATYYDLLNPKGKHLDDLKLDFAVCAGRATPIGGAWIVEHRRLVREKLFDDSIDPGVAGKAPQGRLHQTVKHVANNLNILDSLIALRGKWYSLTGRHGDYLVIHTAGRYRRYFSEQHLNTAYQNIALLLRQNSKLLALYRSSWFLDPKVVQMEPKLAFLSHTPIQQGAVYGPVKAIESGDIEAVLRRSPTRTAAYDSGDYRPWSWGYLWHRDDLLSWSDRRPC